MMLALSQNTAERAARFAETWGLSMEPTAENKTKLQNIMDEMKPEPKYRKEAFFRQKNEIVDMAAYFGELIAISERMPGQWYWRELSEGHPFYAVKSTGFNVLRRVVSAWNFGTEFLHCSLKRFPL